MRRVTTEGRSVARVIAIGGVLSIGFATGACSNSSSSCPGPPSFQVFQSSLPVSAIPLCTDSTGAGNNVTVEVTTPNGTFAYPYPSFPGASPLSDAGIAQCTAICSAAPDPVPCCQSQWEAQTILLLDGLSVSMPRLASLLALASIAGMLATASRASAQAVAVAEQPEPVHPLWHEGDPVPRGYALAKRGRQGLISGGAVLFGVTYAVNVVGVAVNFLSSGPHRENWLLAPGVGPFILMTQTTSPVGNVFLALDTIAEVSGIAMVAYGLASPVTVLVPSDSTWGLDVRPMLGAGRAGLALVGQF